MNIRENTHLDDGALLALLDGELDAEAQRHAEAHAGSCAECAERRDELVGAGRRLSAMLEAGDAPSPWAEMPEALRRAHRDAPRSITSARSSRRARSSRAGWVGRRSIATAAGLTLMLAAGAYAFPGSPVRGWVDDGIESITTLLGAGDSEPAESRPSVVSVEPDGGSVRVSVIGASAGLRVTITLTDASSAAVSARQASFRVESGLIEITGASGDLIISLPRGAVAGSVEVNGVEVARLEGGELLRTVTAEPGPAEIVVQTGG